MSDQTILNALKELFNLYLAWNHKRKGRIKRARRRLDKALCLNSKPEQFVLAFDGLVMIAEGHPQAAYSRLRECLRNVGQPANAGDEYVALYCQFWLDASNPELGFEEIEGSANRANDARPRASRLLQIFLPSLPTDALKDICGHRKSPVAPSLSVGDSNRQSKTDIVFEF